MKIAIVTITELDNFGNRLQNYALQSTLESMGFDVETIHNYIVYKNRRSIKYRLSFLKQGILKYQRNKDKTNFSILLKQRRFENFDKKYFKFSKEYSTMDFIDSSIDSKYDYFVAGSDQIWNPEFRFNFEFNFLRFTNKTKRIVYAASIGVGRIPTEKQQMFKEYINDIDHVSVREFEGSKIIKELCNKEVPVVLDPTMLFDEEKWSKIEKKPKWITNGRYILLYYLGKTKNKEDIIKDLYDRYPDMKKYRVVDIGNADSIKQYSTTPDEFIWLIHNAELVITDSFHGTVFSILLNKPFLSVERDGNGPCMNSRVISLLSMLGLESKLPWNLDYGSIFEHDYTDAYRILEKERKQSYQYLKRALNIE